MEDLAYDNHTGNVKHTYSYTISYVFMYSYMSIRIGALIGFNDLGDINSHLDEYETQVASKELRAPLTTFMLLLMVRSLFTHLKFPYAQFPCTGLAGNY